jgi:DNA-binding transcriptional ArsR family regulator
MAEDDLVIRDPRALRALAHPVRLEILERLGVDGPQTATVLGAAVGISPSAASYHLRALERHGLVVDAGGGTGRNRPWRATGTGFMFEPSEHVAPAAQAAVQLLSAQLVARAEQETLVFLAHEAELDPAWRAASHVANATLRLTADEAVELVRRIDEVVAPYYRSTRDDAPEDAVSARFLLRLFPHVAEARSA